MPVDVVVNRKVDASSPIPRQLSASASGHIHQSTERADIDDAAPANGAVTFALSRPVKLRPFLLSALHTMRARSRVVVLTPTSLCTLRVTSYTPHSVGVRVLCCPMITYFLPLLSTVHSHSTGLYLEISLSTVRSPLRITTGDTSNDASGAASSTSICNVFVASFLPVIEITLRVTS